MEAAAQERRAAEADLAALRSVFDGLGHGARAVDIGALTAFVVDAWPDHPWSNGVHVHGPVSQAQLEAGLAVLSGATSPYVSLSDAHDHPDWRDGHGFTEGLRLERMVAPARSMAVADRRVEVTLDADVVAAVCHDGFGVWRREVDAVWWRVCVGRPGWTHLLAYDGDVAVATGALHVAGPTTYVGAAATVPAARGRGAQSALLAARLRLAAEQGAREVSVKVEPGGASQRNLARHGFVTVGSVTQWRRAAPSLPT